MRKLIGLLFTLYFLCSCETQTDPNDIINVDRAFSDYSAEHGFKKAFIEYAHASVVMLRDKKLPIVGRPALIDHFNAQNDSGIVFRWNPLKGEVARSGDLAYTYGTYEIIATQDTSKGTYVSVWKRDKKGAWKFVLDSGNEGGVE